MRIKLLSIVISIVFALMLTGCFGALELTELEFLTTETGFPISFVRQSDGAQIALGMSRNEIENILGEVYLRERPINLYVGAPDEFEGNIIGWEHRPNTFLYMDISRNNKGIEVRYNDDGIAVRIVVACRGWFINHITQGDNLQIVIDGGTFEHIIENDEYPFISAVDNPENPIYVVRFTYDERENINTIGLSYVPENGLII